MESECGFFCYVEGLGTPNVRHRTLDRAIVEANRLSGMEPKRSVYVMGAVYKLEGNGKPVDVKKRGQSKEQVIVIKKKRLLEIS